MNVRTRFAVGIAWALVCVTRSPALGAPAELRDRPSVVSETSTSRLLSVERSVLPPPLTPGPPTHTDLPAYYAASNPQLRERFERLQGLFEQGVPFRALTLVAGDAGIGKSFLKREVFRKHYPKEAVFKFDIRERYEAWLRQDVTSLKPDLYCGDQIINRLPVLSKPHGKSPLADLLDSQSATFIVMDSLDELHPDEYVATLEQVERFVFADGDRSVHFVVFGRPCALARYWSGRQSRGDRARVDGASGDRDIELFTLQPPRLQTTGDLLVSSWNYCVWKFAAQRQLTDGSPAPLSFEEYAQWSGADFTQAGPFRMISCKPNRELAPQVRDALLSYAKQQRVVGAALCNLAGNTIMREIVADRVQRALPYDERQVMDAFFDAWLERDYQSDGRPSYHHPEHVDLYLQLLEAVAVRYLVEQGVDRQGYFVVHDSDQIQVVHDDQLLTFPARRILDRSGMVHIDPHHDGQQPYRFEPIWLHRYLVQRHLERRASH